MRAGVKVLHEVIARVEPLRVGALSSAQLVHPCHRFRRIIVPFATFFIEEINVPCRAAIGGNAVFAKRLAGHVRRKGVVEMPDAGI